MKAAMPRSTVHRDSGAHRSLRRLLFYGGASIGLAIGLERSLNFLSSMLAARIGGPQTFGAYAIVLATAGTIASYTGAGIGTTANRFSGQYPRESAGYRGFLRSLMLISVLSGLLAAVLMFAGAKPLAKWMLRNEDLTTFLRFAALSSGALVLLECCRGLFIGQRKFRALLMLSAISGTGLLFVLPVTARISPGAMVVAQGSVAFLTVIICISFFGKLGLSPVSSDSAMSSGPGLRSVLAFGIVQFGAVVGINIASWWIASLVARSDGSLAQMGFYAVGNQFRGLASIAPGFFTLVGYSLLTNESGRSYGGAKYVMLANTFVTASLTIIVGGFAAVVAPWALSVAYGRSYTGGEVVVVVLLATAIIHMSGTPAAHRLSIVSLRATGVINAIWAILIIVIGLVLVPAVGARGAAGAFLVAHSLANAMVLARLWSLKELPKKCLAVIVVAMVGALSLAVLGYLRASIPSMASSFSVSMLAVLISVIAVLLYLGITFELIPARFAAAMIRRKPSDESDTIDDLASA